ncbi:MAG: DEAD/DEAH box helicase [Treponema sp.]|nr:DEAD/DEAH box helicase [Treponema sp.]
MTLNQNLTKTALPLLPWLPEIVHILRQQGRLILQAEPGSGKSTLVPLALLDLPGSIVMLEPRRIAAIGIASRMADILEEPLGKTVGYSVRGDRCISRESRIEVLTEGLLARRIQTNPELPGVSTIIFDEFHERSLFTDLSFALVLDLCRIRPDLKILVMSATMDCDAIAGHLNKSENRQGADKVQVLSCPGKTYPVETEYRPPRTGESIIECCGRTIRSLVEESRGSSHPAILAFLPGRREIAAVSELLSDLGSHTEVLPLHGSLPLSEQRRVLRSAEPGTKRVILATNIAETSLTVPDVSIVVDTGLVRLQRYHLRTGMDRLSLEAASIQSADQRRGRAILRLFVNTHFAVH